MEIIIILIMLFCEIMFVEGSNIIRYNRYKSEKKMLFVMLFYSIICLYYAVGNSGSLWIKYICWIGFFQGIFGIVENLINKKKYREKDEFIRTFEKNVFIILSLDMLEKYTVSELKLLKELNKKNSGQKCRDILLIQKDKKKNKIMLMFFLRNQANNVNIRQYCERNYNIEEIKENNKKQIIMCYLK